MIFSKKLGYVIQYFPGSALLSLKSNEVYKNDGDQWLLANHTQFRGAGGVT